MTKVITYGTFDLFHEGHYRLLQRAKALGDYLIVGVTTEEYDKARGKLNVIFVTQLNGREIMSNLIIPDYSDRYLIVLV